MGVKCLNCDNLMVPPRVICKECKGKKLEWFEFKSEGKLETFSIIHVGPTAHKDKVPYCIGVVRFMEGPMLTGRLIGVEPDKPENIRVGMKVIAEFIHESGQTILAFKPV